MLKNGEHIYLFELVILSLNDKDNLNICFPFKNEIVLFSDPLKIIHFSKFKKKYIWESIWLWNEYYTQNRFLEQSLGSLWEHTPFGILLKPKVLSLVWKLDIWTYTEMT